jgi:hypothetical protein
MGGGDGGDEEGGLPMGQLVALRQDGSTSAEAMKARARALRHAGGAGSFKREGKHRPMEMTSKKPVPVLREALQGGKRCAIGCGGFVWRSGGQQKEGGRGACCFLPASLLHTHTPPHCPKPAPPHPPPPPACLPACLPACRDVRDPRFESLSAGQYSEDKFKSRYAFLYDEQLPGEAAELRAALGRAKGAGAREALQARLARVEQQLRSEEARRKRQGFKQQVKVSG